MPVRDEYDFGKHYFVLDKKLNNHINAKNNPHNVTKYDLDLGYVENYPLKQTWTFEPGETVSYISSAVVKEQIDLINAKLPPVDNRPGDYVLECHVTEQGEKIYHWVSRGNN